jgi:predicted amidophosphoribosyltransferase
LSPSSDADDKLCILCEKDDVHADNDYCLNCLEELTTEAESSSETSEEEQEKQKKKDIHRHKIKKKELTRIRNNRK